ATFDTEIGLLHKRENLAKGRNYIRLCQLKTRGQFRPWNENTYLKLQVNVWGKTRRSVSWTGAQRPSLAVKLSKARNRDGCALVAQLAGCQSILTQAYSNDPSN